MNPSGARTRPTTSHDTRRAVSCPRGACQVMKPDAMCFREPGPELPHTLPHGLRATRKPVAMPMLNEAGALLRVEARTPLESQP